MTAGGIALVVAVFEMVMAMAYGLRSTITDTAIPDNVIVLSKGATTEVLSVIRPEAFNILRFFPGIRNEGNGQPDASPELPAQVSVERIAGPRENVILRGVLPIALDVHTNVDLVAGRWFGANAREVVVGKGLVGNYKNCVLGGKLVFGRDTWTVVGIFEANATTFESEMWGNLRDVQSLTRRQHYYASVRLKCAQGVSKTSLLARLQADPKMNIEGKTEEDYYRDQSATADEVRRLGLIMAIFMGFGSMFGAVNTMYTSVATRFSEIGTLRAIGFSPGAIMTSFLAESLILGICGGVLGIALALPLNGINARFGSALALSTLAFKFTITPVIAFEGLLFAAAIGVFAGWLPAMQAMKLEVSTALRS
jgi:putative ABC transport system permease protein